jgi:twinkle protein
MTDIIDGKIVALPHRKISEDTCRKFGYSCVRMIGDVIEVATYLRDGVPVGQKFRGPNKKFWTAGDMRNAPLWGQWLWSGGGRKLVITEGEIDCMSVSQVQENKWPVVSLPNGAAGAKDAIRRNLEWVTSFDEVILCFDMDDPGRKAAAEVAQILPPGKCRVASLSRKDANEMLVNGEADELQRSVVWNSMAYRPDGIVRASEIKTDDEIDSIEIWPYPWWGLTEYALGQRPGEISMWTSGTGSGKSTIIRSITADHVRRGRNVGIIMLEESPASTIDDIVSDFIRKPVRRIRYQKALNRLYRDNGLPEKPIRVDYTKDEYEAARNDECFNRLFVYDHTGSRDDQSIESKIEYLAVSADCKVIVLDHITAAVAGKGGGGTSEREVIDKIMSALDRITVRTAVHIHVICQLKKGDKAFEEGDRCTLQDLKGAGSLSTVPHNIWFAQRYCLDRDPVKKNTTYLWSLKNRLAGDRRGLATALVFDPERHGFQEFHCGLDEKDNPFTTTPVSQPRKKETTDGQSEDFVF